MDERRQYVRINKSVEVTYQVIKSFLKSGTRSADLSLAGIRLPVMQRLGVGTMLKMEIRFTGLSEPVKITGQVAWLAETEGGEFPFEIGVKFGFISLQDLDTLKQMINKADDNPDNLRFLD
ncbi:MAG: hypothetical protein COV72_02770 [Candidatus Omnitrophica bacterium CG11_big_fil_rev_8_21_14_0_20_42_13]|uniref:PilZ domain-containing protein n=1 Tax=Candidatus Ghiorseimicrobium undicola TaxID=1974746 RepID=A0A2H0LYJ3_9BACT|nr:MAG: hypothetical protein COV72_02770 [Candidatus Omnitrophica bacterium CG11_big_fil_rev_8_21_14_0_20_42_13]